MKGNKGQANQRLEKDNTIITDDKDKETIFCGIWKEVFTIPAEERMRIMTRQQRERSHSIGGRTILKEQSKTLQIETD